MRRKERVWRSLGRELEEEFRRERQVCSADGDLVLLLLLLLLVGVGVGGGGGGGGGLRGRRGWGFVFERVLEGRDNIWLVLFVDARWGWAIYVCACNGKMYPRCFYRKLSF